MQQQNTQDTPLLPAPLPPPTHQSDIYCSLFAANTIAFPPRSKWPPPRRHFDKELGNLTPRGYLDPGKARSAVSAGGAAAAAGATGEAHAQQAERAGTAATTA